VLGGGWEGRVTVAWGELLRAAIAPVMIAILVYLLMGTVSVSDEVLKEEDEADVCMWVRGVESGKMRRGESLEYLEAKPSPRLRGA